MQTEKGAEFFVLMNSGDRMLFAKDMEKNQVTTFRDKFNLFSIYLKKPDTLKDLFSEVYLPFLSCLLKIIRYNYRLKNR